MVLVIITASAVKTFRLPVETLGRRRKLRGPGSGAASDVGTALEDGGHGCQLGQVPWGEREKGAALGLRRVRERK